MRWKRSSAAEASPVLAVLGEVEVLRAPLLALPQLVELPVVEQLHLAAVGRLEDGRITGRLEVLAVGPARRGIAHSRLPPPVRWLGRASVPEIGWLANYGPGSAEATIVRRLGEPVLFVTT